MHGGVVEPARLLFCAPSIVPRSAIIHFSHSDITDNRLATQHCGTACCLQRGQCYNVQAAGAPTGKQFTSPSTIAYQLATRTGARGTHFLRLCTPRAPARPTRARACPDGRADSTALRSATRALPPCAAGLMHSTRAHGAGIAAIAAIRQSPRDGNERADDGLKSIISIGSKTPELYYSTLYGKEMARQAVNTRSIWRDEIREDHYVPL